MTAHKVGAVTVTAVLRSGSALQNPDYTALQVNRWSYIVLLLLYFFVGQITSHGWAAAHTPQILQHGLK
jgi:hypothetical protein